MNNKIHYAWINMIIVCLITMGTGAQIMSQSVFLIPLRETLNVNTTSISFAFSIPALMYIFLAPLYAKIFSNKQLKNMALFLVLCQITSLLIASFTNGLLITYISYIFFGLCFNASLSMLPAMTVKKWFKDASGFALSVMITFSMVGGTIFSPIASSLINKYNFRVAYRCLAAFVALINVPLTFLIKDKPSDIGLIKYEKENSKEIEVKENDESFVEETSNSIWKTKKFYLAILYCIFVQYGQYMEQHMVNMLASIGFSSLEATTAVSACFFGGLTIRIFLSLFNDKLGIKNTTFICSGIGGITCLILCVMGYRTLAILCVVSYFFGIALKSGLVQSSTMCHVLYGRNQEYSQIYGNILMVSGIVNATSSTVMGMIYDSFGNYNPILIAMAIMYACSIPLSNIITKEN